MRKKSRLKNLLRLRGSTVVPKISMPKPTLPYPQKFQKKKMDAQFTKFLNIFNKIHINIRFADALEQMLNYVKFIKDTLSKKRHLGEFETVNLTEECNAIL